MWGITSSVFILSILACLMQVAPSQAGEPIRCSCRFDAGSGYSAVGTRAACSTYTKEKACTIAFGGLGAQEPKISELGIDPSRYQDQILRLTMANLEVVRINAPEKIANPEFLQQAIVAYMRAAYLREGLGMDRSALLDLDRQVQDLSKEFAGSITDVFLSKRAPFEASWRGNSSIEVQKGAIRFFYAGQITLVAVFFSSP